MDQNSSTTCPRCWRLLRVVSLLAAFGLLILCIKPSFAHVMSLSKGELSIKGSHVTYDLRMPLYEIGHLKRPRETLINNFLVRSGGRTAQPKNTSCREETTSGWYICRTEFEFSKPVDQIDVECYFSDVIVANHVHLLSAKLGDIKKQSVFDFNTKKTTIDFVPPTPTELAWSEAGVGMTRVIMGPMQILFVLGLCLAGRSRKELFHLTTAFLLCELAAAFLFSIETWQPSARFLEAAGALTVAYLAIEILLLPEAGYRWVVAATMGIFHGFYFGNFLSQAAMNPFYVLAGVAVAEISILIIFVLLLKLIGRSLPRSHLIKTAAILLLSVGVLWFLLRLQS